MDCPPNILFIISDQHNAKCVGHEGHVQLQTPALDRLAAEGTRFTACTTANPICTPSRVSFLSGQYAHNHGIYGLGGPTPRGVPTVLGHFRRHGYLSAAVGKIHCPAWWVEDDSDYFREVCGGCSIGGTPEYQAHIASKGLTEVYRLSEGRSGPSGRGQCIDGYVSDLPWEDTPEGWTVRQAQTFMDAGQAAGKPFIIQVSFHRPHQNYAPTQEYWDAYPNPQLPPNADYDQIAAGKAPHLIAGALAYRENTDWVAFEPRTYDAGRRRKLRGYFGNIGMVDRAVGELLDHLDACGLAEDTVVIYSSDHGDYACEHGLMEKAPGICADAITRIPMIWRVPGLTIAGRAVGEVVESVDLAPTICALAGLPPLSCADGHDLSAILGGAAGDPDRVGVTEFAWSKSLRWRNWRLVRYPRGMFAEHPEGFRELYDLSEDPWEMRNRAQDPACADLCGELEARLFDWLLTTQRVVSTNAANPAPGPEVVERFHVRVGPDGRIGSEHLHALVARGGNINYL